MIDDLMKHYGEHKDLFYDRLESALRTARNEALEEAARIADDYTKRKVHNYSHTGANIAVDIRKHGTLQHG